MTLDKIKTMSGLPFKNTSKMIDHCTIDISFSDKPEKDSREDRGRQVTL